MDPIEAGRSHGQWIDYWRSTCTTRWLTLVDSDVEFLGDGWLSGAIDEALTNSAALVTPGWSEEGWYREPGADWQMWSVRRPHVYTLLIDHDATKDVAESFAYSMQTDERRVTSYDTGALFAQRVLERDLRVHVMSSDLLAKIHHVAGLSWSYARDQERLGRRGRIRRRLARARLEFRLMSRLRRCRRKTRDLANRW